MNRSEALQIVVEMLAAESSCRQEDLRNEEVTVATLQPERFESPHQRRFQYLEPTLSITSLGTGGVVAASPEWIGWIGELFEGLSRDETFAWPALNQVAQHIGDRSLYGPIPHFVCSSDSVRDVKLPGSYELRVFYEGEIPDLDPPAWPHAISRHRDPRRPEVLAAIAYDGNQPAGVAIAVADSDTMWQIGIDVATAHRSRGIGSALTGAVARLTLKAGKVPYYATGPANIPSIRNALSAGFWPCWMQVATLWN